MPDLPTHRLAGATILVLLLTACASSGEGRIRGPRDRILREELAQYPAMTALDAVRQLRPHWLNRRGEQSIADFGETQVQVHVDGSRRGGPEALQAINIRDVEELRYLDAGEATTRFGTGYPMGVILVAIRGGGLP
ncbi:MAG: hypothetical protein JSU98_12605 [Gemmatimonadales bacterium]|nr:MAG: hypothetical protein JSU98_12605 [Gemmatimonadales bacterium]